MVDPDIQQAATFLATHALLLLALAIIALLVAVAAIVGAVRVVLHYRDLLLRGFRLLVTSADRFEPMRTLRSRARSFLPGAYIALHLALGLVLVIAAAVFLAIAEAVLAVSEIVVFDNAFAAALHASSSRQWQAVFAVITALGSGWVLAVAAAVIGVALIRRGQRVIGFAWMAAQLGGAILNGALKEIYERARPEFADAFLYSSSFSFPSGHAMGTFVFCGLGSYLILRRGSSWTRAALTIGLAASWCVIMAFSRLYLGVHFVSDVVAGLIAGSAWLAVCISALEVIRRRSQSVVRNAMAQGPG